MEKTFKLNKHQISSLDIVRKLNIWYLEQNSAIVELKSPISIFEFKYNLTKDGPNNIFIKKSSHS